MFSACVKTISESEPSLPEHWFAQQLQDINGQVNPRTLKFKKNIYGKPEVEWPIFDDWDPPPLNFNISHTSSLIACGVTVNSPIGVDVEEKQRRLKSDILSFARRYFSPHEVETLTMISDPEVRCQEFIKLWTLKEAYVKALGRGFSAVPFKTFTIQLREGTKEDRHVPQKLDNECRTPEIVVESSNDSTMGGRNFQFSLLELDGSHYAAICIENDKTIDGEGCVPSKLNVWKTIPFVKDEYVSGTKAVVPMGGLIQRF
ncbi:L-aminoadipate-semialdehyde dehydrogenase-phosphopantetheinyl transferase-like isoform X2 [Tripterygium wilfordii]|uniref:L-aminoadipate-semialdehyde dehydrogenase-phosphopantetheinyl transferase-like isoform X2 n=1 Tax=Tripterygium wilfordii TaxID=458696 RepID=UPI0018F82254|nr:L-aminoadipate-semialdehyde dehydrogenase-phosphopantetheinyl transferase-like isoform X2 [Tripterygium wilfordii]